MQGRYLVIEGIEGAGKSTVTAAVAAQLRTLQPQEVLATRHPGATPLGRHLRILNKYPEQIDPQIRLDPLSSQLLMVADHSAFTAELLEPALAAGTVVIADRSNFISSLAYGHADGLELQQLQQLFQAVRPPRADRMYVLQLPWQEGMRRVRQNNGGDGIGLDRFERKGDAFFQRVGWVYDSLLTGPAALVGAVTQSVAAENIRYVRADRPVAQVVAEIVSDARMLLATPQ